MLTPEEYVDAQLRGPARPATLTHAEATAAVAQALADAERYKNTLLRVLRHVRAPATLLDLLGEGVPNSGHLELGEQRIAWRCAPGPSQPPAGEEPPF